MFLTSILFLLLLPCSIFAKSIPRATPEKHHDKRTGCVPHFGSSLFHSTLFFADRYAPFHYAISTRHITYYPSILRMAMQLYDLPTVYLSKDEECGWHKVKSVSSSFGFLITVHSGDVYWKYSDLRWVHESKTSNVSSHWTADEETHIPPSTAGPKPDKRTLDAIVRILENNSPAGDVYEIATIVLGYWFTFTGFAVLMGLFMACTTWVRRAGRSAMPTTWHDDGDAIELDTIKTPDTQNSAAPPHESEAPKYSFEDRCHASASSTDTLRSESLPIYSVDGAGR